MKKPLALIALLAALALAASACGGGSSSSGGGETEAAAGEATGASAAACTPESMETQSSGTLTVATDKPAYPPYFEDDEPANGEGFESAVAYAIAKQLGYAPGDVKWTVEPFNASFAPGQKNFDFDVNQISITPQREKAVDFSAPYYTANQAVVALKGSEAANAKSLADLKSADLGVQVGTTSLEAVEQEIEPDSAPEVFNSSNDVVQALKNKQIDAVVVDLPTALYLTAVQVPTATVVGQFEAPGGDQWGALLAKDSPLTACVSQAIEELEESGELEKITQRWMSQGRGALNWG
ncbi:MAG: ABC transporter substrate-binding protein [Solirubrobacterales bacterium]